MSFSRDQIAEVVSRVVDELASRSEAPSGTAAVQPTPGLGGCDSVAQAVQRARAAFEKFQKVSLNDRRKVIARIRELGHAHLETIARLGHEETGMGRYEDKIEKNRLVLDKTPGVEDLVSVTHTGDEGLTLTEGAPYGVIGAITPTTNPTETIFCNAIGMIAAGNALVFNAHPRAKGCCNFAVHLIHEAIEEVCGVSGLVNIISEPSQQSAQDLMSHPNIRLLVVTGGGGIVKAAFASGKKVIAAGPGNPPAIVDETADLDQAAKDIILGATLDNNILCIAEKEIFVVDSVANDFMEALKRNGAYQVIGSNCQKLENLIFDGSRFNPDYIGQNAGEILKKIGIQCDSGVRMAFMETGKDHFLVQKEQMMPVLPVVRCKDVHTAIDWAIEAEHGNCHTATMHSKNLDALHTMAVRCDCSIFVKNGPSCAGLGYQGEGHTTMSIASPTGEGITSARTFTRSRRCVLRGHFRIV